MKTHLGPVTTVARLLLAAVMIIAPIVAVTPAVAATAPHSPAAVPVAGTGKATAHSTTVKTAMGTASISTRSTYAGALGRDGRPTGSELPTATTGTAARPAPHDPAIRPGGPNTGKSTAAGTNASTNTAAIQKAPTQGVSQGGSGCVNCSTPDVTAAVSTTEIAETVNLQLQVLNKSTNASLCTVSLPNLLGAATSLAGPRIQYDNAANRFSIVIDSVPGSAFDVPIQYLATSQTSDACGAWWIYSIIFSGTGYPLGSLLDFPYLGQDSTSLLSSTNNFSFTGSYLGSTAFAMPKAIAYTGGAFTFNTFSVAFSTAPVTVGGIPTANTTNTYWVAAVPGTGYDLYVMPTNPAGAISLQATINDPFSAPTHRVAQPGTSQTLDPLDGRIGSAAVQTGNIVWFAHGVDDQGLPTVRYGGIDVTANQDTTALAFHGTGSYDFNPSIGVFPVSGNTDNVWVNWAYTDPSNGVATSATVAGVPAGGGVPDLVGQDLTLVSGSATATHSGFGRYSSVAIDPSATSSCPAGFTALTAQEFFTGEQWTTELARTTFC
jgi:hypothetical protein